MKELSSNLAPILGARGDGAEGAEQASGRAGERLSGWLRSIVGFNPLTRSTAQPPNRQSRTSSAITFNVPSSLASFPFTQRTGSPRIARRSRS